MPSLLCVGAMKRLHLLALTAAMAAVTIFAAAEADAQRGPGVTIGGWSNPPPPRHGGGHHRNPGRHHAFPVLILEREAPVIIEREVVVREVPAVVEAPAPPPPPRPAHVIGKTYAALPGACMKMLEDGASYYLCDGEWYRQVGKQYRAVAPRSL